jgi:hypothetical protein
MDQSDELLVGEDPKRLATVARPQHPWGPPVAGETAAVSCQQYCVDRARGGTEILLILHGIIRAKCGRSDERRRPVELRRCFWTGCLLQPRKRDRADNAETPRVRQMMIGRPPRQLEQRLQELWRHGLRTERLVRAPIPDRVLNIHRHRTVTTATSQRAPGHPRVTPSATALPDVEAASRTIPSHAGRRQIFDTD